MRRLLAALAGAALAVAMAAPAAQAAPGPQHRRFNNQEICTENASPCWRDMGDSGSAGVPVVFGNYVPNGGTAVNITTVQLDGQFEGHAIYNLIFSSHPGVVIGATNACADLETRTSNAINTVWALVVSNNLDHFINRGCTQGHSNGDYDATHGNNPTLGGQVNVAPVGQANDIFWSIRSGP